MRLTNTIRDAFIRSVLNDVPSVDYNEQMRKVLTEDLHAQLPAEIQTLAKNPKLVGYLETGWSSFDSGVSITYVCSSAVRSSPTDKARKVVDELKIKRSLQEKARADLRSKLKSVAYSVSTRKALVAALPEFEKYLPADEAKAVRTLPVVQNVVADFVKAGWPARKGAKC